MALNEVALFSARGKVNASGEIGTRTLRPLDPFGFEGAGPLLLCVGVTVHPTI
jgi:hypothetical protein